MAFFCYCVAMASKKQYKKPVVFLVTLGCAKNVVDSEKMLACIGQAGFLITGDVDNADVVVINTCGFIAPARDEAIETIARAVESKNKGLVKRVIVAGCLPQRLGRALFSEVEGIDAIVGLSQRDSIASIIKATLLQPGKGLYLAGSNKMLHDDRGRFLLTPPHWAYLRISEGCDRACSFCTIPAIRGPFRSKPQQVILEEARQLVQNGAVELDIIAQDTSCYGRDLKPAASLSNLINKLQRIDHLRWIRLMYLYPSGIDKQLIETIAQSSKVVKYIDMPVQHINSQILRQMRRAQTKEKTVTLIKELRQAIPEVVLRTTVMVGFPGETQQQFDELLEFVSWAEFDALGCFSFYPESGTLAAEMPNQIPEELKKQRLDMIMTTQQEIAFAKGSRQIGKELICLVDTAGQDSAATGRYYGQAPDIDGLCLIDNCSHNPGDFVKATVIAAEGYDLVVREI